MSGRKPSRSASRGGLPKRGVPRRGNPLRRSSDRLWSWVDALLIVVLVAGTLTAAVAAGRAGYEDQSVRVEQQQSEQREVTARLTTNAGGSAALGAGDLSQRARVAWTTRDGETRADTAPVPNGAEEGDRVRIRVDRTGDVVGRPQSSTSPAMEAVVAALMATGAVGAAMLAARSGLRRLFDRHHHRCWEKEWAAVEPGWSGQGRE